MSSRIRTGLLITPLLCFWAFAQGSEWKLADPNYALSFPRDHASHPDNRIEWWYYTGNLETSDGRRFGYQLTFFRYGLVQRPSNPSRWAIRDLYMAHFAISDLSRGSFHFAERLNRAGIGWAGGLTDRYRVWNEDWEAHQDESGTHVLRARDGKNRIAIDLRLVSLKPAVLHGEKAYSQKGAEKGNATHYYSLTRMQTMGKITIGNNVFDVTGSSWMDHEFGTSLLEPGQIGWNWFSVQFDDLTEVMFYAFRRSDHSTDPRSGGTFVEKSGAYSHIRAGDIELKSVRTWKSNSTGAVYPVEWKLSIPARRIELLVSAALDSQELDTKESTRVVYWEGAVKASGSRESEALRGRGYLEMTGYAGQTLDRVLN